MTYHDGDLSELLPKAKPDRLLGVAFPTPSETDGAEEDTERDRQDGTVAQEGARATGHRHGGEGDEIPGS
jgi:hypothetical protein